MSEYELNEKCGENCIFSLLLLINNACIANQNIYEYEFTRRQDYIC